MIDCYGELDETSNFYVVCEDEENDGIWANGNPDNPEGVFQNWLEVKQVLSRYFDDIVEISAV